MHRIFHKRSLLQSQKLLRRERAIRWIKISFVIVLIAGLLYGLSALSKAPMINIQTILVSGNSAVSSDDILVTTREILQGHRLLIFSRSNIFWYPKQQIINTLEHSYLWIDSVSIDRVNSTTISLNIKERVPVMVWCGVSREKAGTCQLMDSLGYLFAKAPEFSGTAYIKLYGPITDAGWRGSNFYTPSGLNHVFLLTKALPEIGFQPTEVEVVNDNQYNLFLNSGTRISVQVSDQVSTIVANLSSLLTQKAFADSQIDNFANLLYIDARFGNKLFYKFN